MIILFFSSHQCYAILSQYGQNHYVILDFGASKEVKVVQSKLSQSPSQFAVSSASLFSTLFHSLTEKITVVNAGGADNDLGNIHLF